MTSSEEGGRAAARERIQVTCARLEAVPADAVVRPIRSDGAALTAAARLLEVGAGESVLSRLEAAGDLPVGGALLTPGGELAASFIIHAVLQSPAEPISLAIVRRALLNVLRRAAEWELDSIALPPLGTGAGNLDAEDAAGAMLPALLQHLEGSGHPARVVLVVAAGYEEEVFRRILEAVAEGHDAREEAAGADPRPEGGLEPAGDPTSSGGNGAGRTDGTADR